MTTTMSEVGLYQHIISLLPENYTKITYVEPFDCMYSPIWWRMETPKLSILNDEQSRLLNLMRCASYASSRLKLLMPMAYDDNPDSMVYQEKFDTHLWSAIMDTTPNRALVRLRHRLDRAVLEHLTWQEMIDRHDNPHSLMVCCPPIWFTGSQHEALADRLTRTLGDWVVIVQGGEYSNLYNQLKKVGDMKWLNGHTFIVRSAGCLGM